MLQFLSFLYFILIHVYLKLNTGSTVHISSRRHSKKKKSFFFFFSISERRCSTFSLPSTNMQVVCKADHSQNVKPYFPLKMKMN